MIKIEYGWQCSRCIYANTSPALVGEHEVKVHQFKDEEALRVLYEKILELERQIEIYQKEMYGLIQAGISTYQIAHGDYVTGTEFRDWINAGSPEVERIK